MSEGSASKARQFPQRTTVSLVVEFFLEREVAEAMIGEVREDEPALAQDLRVEAIRLFACWRLVAMSGMRRGELLGLTWRAVDFEGGRLTLDQQLVPTRGGLTIAAPKTARSRRTVALDEETVDALRAHREAQLVERAFLGEAYVDRDLVFAREDGEPIHPQRLTEAFGRHVKTAKLAPIRLHDLRHTHATLALTNGVPLHVVAARIGDDPRTLLKTYAHLLPTSDAEAAGRIAALV